MPQLEPLTVMYAAIGQAVVYAQIFETLVAVCSEMVRCSKKYQGGEPTDFAINNDRFRVATMRIIKELATSNEIDRGLETRIASLMEKRHILVHRWSIDNGWPGHDDLKEIQRVIDLANEVIQESSSIGTLLTGYLLKINGEEGDLPIKLGSVFKRQGE